IEAANVAITEMIAEILVSKYEPKLVILGTSFVDYTERRESRVDERFLENSWLLYELGEFSIKGWLLKYSYAFRILTLLSYGTSQVTTLGEINLEAQNLLERITPTGYKIYRKVFDTSAGVKKSVQNRLLDQFGGFTFSPWNLSGLEDFMNLQEKGTQVLIVEMPHHSSYVSFLDDFNNPKPEGEAVRDFVKRIYEMIEEMAKENGVYFWPTSDQSLIPQDGWSDRSHLNIIGSEALSGWLAEQIILMMENGYIESPSPAE
ncbi:MAG: hypothetical protein N2D54_09840, partial [Chloroflexota bacterium]